MPELDLPTARWLTSPEGLATVEQVTRRVDEGDDPLRLATRLAADLPDPARRSAAIDAAVARVRARERWPAAERCLFTREGLEQASDPVVAAHRATRLVAAEGGAVVDLCSGLGGDAIALAQALAGTRASTQPNPEPGPAADPEPSAPAAAPGTELLAIDADPARMRLLEHNLEVVGATAATRVADVLATPLPAGARWHADPRRRRAGRRVRHLAEHVPPVTDLLATHGAGTPSWALTLAPGVDPADPALPDDIEVEYVQLGDQLVEATVWGGSSFRAPADDRDATAAGSPDRAHPDAGRRRTRATLLSADGLAPAISRPAPPGPRQQLPVGEVGDVLIEVAPAAVRARLHDRIGAEISARRLARHRALLTSDHPPAPSPWYRARTVLAVLPGRTRDVRAWLAAHAGEGPVDRGVELVLHGVDAQPDRLWRDLGRPPRGPHGVRLEFVRRDADTVTLVTDPIPVTHPRGTIGV